MKEVNSKNNDLRLLQSPTTTPWLVWRKDVEN